MSAQMWETILADRSLRDLPYKIETNRYNKIIMSPDSAWHGSHSYKIGRLLGTLLPHGEVINEPPVVTGEGVRVPDVAWMSREKWGPNKRATTLPVAPEICVEVVSPSNTRAEMLDKMTLYYAKGAKEVWLCDVEGRMEFFTALSAPASVTASEMCPDFPTRIDVD